MPSVQYGFLLWKASSHAITLLRDNLSVHRTERKALTLSNALLSTHERCICFPHRGGGCMGSPLIYVQKEKNTKYTMHLWDGNEWHVLIGTPINAWELPFHIRGLTKIAPPDGFVGLYRREGIPAIPLYQQGYEYRMLSLHGWHHAAEKRSYVGQYTCAFSWGEEAAQADAMLQQGWIVTTPDARESEGFYGLAPMLYRAFCRCVCSHSRV